MTDPFHLRKVQESFDWISYIEKNFAFKFSPNGEYRINCIHCTNNKKKLYINVDKGYFNCFACDFKTGKFDIFDFVAKTESIPRHVAMMRLSRDYKETTPVDIEYAVKRVMTAVEDLCTETRRFKFPLDGMEKVTPERTEFFEYLQGRGLTPEEISDCGVYCCGSDLIIYDDSGKMRGNLKNRVIFPVYGTGNKVVSYQARIINDSLDTQKYLAAPDSDLKKTLWPYVPPKGQEIILVEGILDSLALRRLGLNAYACFGKAISKEQIEVLKSWKVREVTILFDIKDAKNETLKYCEKLNNIFSKVFVIDFASWPLTRDPGDCLNNPTFMKDLEKLVERKVKVNSLKFIEWKMKY